MKHCHFSILYNELPFLKQKLSFLYKHFDQLIFYDLNINTFEFSNDGSHEFIKNFPDPENKITLIEQKNLLSAINFHGKSFVQKKQMFAIGSLYIKNNIDIFWCTDLDEFFNKQLIKDIEYIYKTTDSNTILIPHIIYYKNENYILPGKENTGVSRLPYARIMKYNPGRIFGHCEDGQDPIFIFDNNYLYHFAFIGNKRMKFKSELYEKENFYTEWKNFNFDKSNCIISQYTIPEYINIKEMMNDLNIDLD
jgi:hypothetical protein